jgi:DNA polymerase I-like protein with 3'-5' exonuclease and polymerase domains
MYVNILAIDIEHSYGPMRPWEEGFYMSCIGIVRSDGIRETLWIEHEQRERSDLWDKRVQEHLDWADIVVAHNLKHDMTILRNYSISFEKVKLWCTMVVEYVLSGQDTRQRTFSLDDVCKHYGMAGKLDMVAGMWAKGTDTYYINSDLLEEYVMDDTQKCFDLYYRQNEMVDAEGMRKVVDLQNEFTMSLSDMELYGFRFDVDLAEQMVAKYEAEMNRMASEIRQIAYADLVHDPNDELTEEFNPSSDVQRSALLFGGQFTIDGKEWTTRELKYETKMYQRNAKITCSLPGLWSAPPTKKRNQDGSVPVDKTTLSKLRCKTPEQKIVLSALTEYGKIKKARETLKGKTDTKGLLNKIRTDGWIHPNLNQCVTVTGRLSGSDPNTQNMPRGSTSPLKKCILPKLDKILQIDLSQIEWRCAAWLSQDAEMIREINNDIDQHTRACTELMELEFSKDNRTKAKVFNFRMIYGGVAYGYYMDDNMPNFPLKKWEKIVDGFHKKYWGLYDFNYANISHVMRYGELRLPTGRKYKFLSDDKGEYQERQIKNYPVQGMAGGDILPLMAVMMRRGLLKLGLKSHFILTVHDSLVFDVLESEMDEVINLITKCVQNLATAVGRYYDLNWNVKLNGEIETGDNYGSIGDTIKV